MIGLGLTAIGFGTRYATNWENLGPGEVPHLKLFQIDKPLLFIMVFLVGMTIIGLGMAIVGLAYHHRRRHHEMEHNLAHPEARHHANT
jgi:hypothetical protein